MPKVLLIIIFLLLCSYAQEQKPPPGGTPKDFNLPQKSSYALENGLKVTLVQFGTVPKVNARLVVRVGKINESADEVGLADLTTDFFKEGTQTRSAKDIAEQAAQIGGEINVSTGPDQTYVGGISLSEFAPQLIELLADIMQNPNFPQTELERLKKDYIRQLSIQKSRPRSQALERFRKLLYPAHPYGRIYPDEEQINKYDISRIKDFYSKNYGAKITHLYVVGLFDESKVETAIRDNLSGWNVGQKHLEQVPEPISRRMINLIDRPQAPQSTIIIGLPVIDPSHEDYIALQVTNALLGGSFASRITTNIREDKGYTYSPRSSVSTRYRDSYWMQQADVAMEFTGASLKEIFYEIDRLQNELPAGEELQGIKNYLAGVFVLENSSRVGIIDQLSFLDLHGLADSYLTNYVQNIYKVTPENVQRITKNLLRDEEMTIVIVGDIKKIKKQVQAYGKLVF